MTRMRLSSADVTPRVGVDACAPSQKLVDHRPRHIGSGSSFSVKRCVVRLVSCTLQERKQIKINVLVQRIHHRCYSMRFTPAYKTNTFLYRFV